MLEIDGSYGEGGGQILRNTIALSALTGKPVKVKNIRANRPNPGVKAQHYIAVQSIGELCNAEISGLEIESPSITFKPGKIKGGKYKFEVGTAGSITLIFQACILSSLNSSDPITITLTGGTDVRWSPSWDYFEQVFVKLIKKMGINVYPKLIIRGYYPKGGGEAIITIYPSEKVKPMIIKDEQEFKSIKGRIHLSNLPDHIAKRMKHSIMKVFLKNDLMSEISSQKTTSLSPGVGVTLWSESKDSVLGSTMLGERGVSSEEVGENAANDFLKEIWSFSDVDVHAFDQILPYLVIAKENGSSVLKVRKLSNHVSTNIWLMQQFFDVDFEAIQNETNFTIKIK